MTPRQYLRSRLGIDDQPTGPNAPTVDDEEILNVLRTQHDDQDGEPELPTTQIADELPVGKRSVQKRLAALNSDGRVDRRRAGQTNLWRLAAGETRVEVNPALGPVIQRSARAKQLSTHVRQFGILCCVSGFGLFLLGMTLLMTGIYQSHFAATLSLGYSSGVVGAFVFMVGVSLRSAGMLAPRLADRYLLD